MYWRVLMHVLSCVGYYYELDDSYDESDEEEVRAHLRRVAEQPPLKLDDSTEVVHQCALQKHSKTLHMLCSNQLNC